MNQNPPFEQVCFHIPEDASVSIFQTKFCSVSRTLFTLLTVSLLLTMSIPAKADTSIVSTISNPLEGGTITGGGSYASGTTAMLQIQANHDWYISGVTFAGPVAAALPGQVNLNPHDQFVKTIQIDRGINPSFDVTLITNFTASIPLAGDCTNTALFTPLSPIIAASPTPLALIAGNTATLTASVTGRLPLSYHWQKDGQTVLGATNSSLTLTNIQLTNSGNYVLLVTNAFGTNETAPALLTIENLGTYANGQLILGQSYSGPSPTTISFQSFFTNGSVFYTLDGSAPDFNATHYAGPFNITSTSTINAIAYSADFSQSVVAGPIAINLPPSYILNLFTRGGGTVLANPPGNSFTSNTVVIVTATANPGFSFMNWSGAITGNSFTNYILMNGPKSVEAIFGTTLGLTVTGQGSVSLHPSASFCPYGSTVLFSAVPNPGNYFGQWGNAASGAVSPLAFTITSANPTVSAVFAPLPTNTASLVVLTAGAGSVIANPPANKSIIGTTNILTAVPALNQRFIGWSGDANGTSNPLSMVMDASKTITANFSHSPQLSISGSGNNIIVSVSGVPGDTFIFQTSTNLIDWNPLGYATSFSGTFSLPLTISPDRQKFMYRVMAQ